MSLLSDVKRAIRSSCRRSSAAPASATPAVPSLARARLASVIPLYSERVAIMRDDEEREGGSDASSAGSEAVLERPLKVCERERLKPGMSRLESWPACRPKELELEPRRLKRLELESKPGLLESRPWEARRRTLRMRPSAARRCSSAPADAVPSDAVEARSRAL
eukprot:scaffold129699_cov48-Phaeocystis_antarctica.AAC.2